MPLLLQLGDLTGAAQRASELVPYTDEEWRMSSLIPVYVAQFRQGTRLSLDDVLSFLPRILQKYELAGTQIGMVKVLAEQAMALQALGRVEDARSALRRALSIAEPEGYVRTFIDHGAPMRELLATVLAAQQTQRGDDARRMVDYVSRLLSALPARTPVGRPAALPSPVLVEPLSDRELEVLRLLASTLSTPEIARELVVSANTVRSHVKSIYGKLNAHGRIEALHRARELGLLPP